MGGVDQKRDLMFVGIKSILFVVCCFVVCWFCLLAAALAAALALRTALALRAALLLRTAVGSLASRHCGELDTR